jgi:hypothetical protein
MSRIGYKTDHKGCWIPTSRSKNDSGYPIIYRDGRKIKLSHVMYEARFGAIPEGMVIRHKCDNVACINPDHLEVGTQADNIRDKIERGRQPVGSAHHNAILSDSDRVVAIRMRDGGATISAIAEHLRVGYGVVERALKVGLADNHGGIKRIRLKKRS